MVVDAEGYGRLLSGVKITAWYRTGDISPVFSWMNSTASRCGYPFQEGQARASERAGLKGMLEGARGEAHVGRAPLRASGQSPAISNPARAGAAGPLFELLYRT